MTPSIMAAVGDIHSNSTIGVNPPEVQLNEGGTWIANRTNRWRWQCWNDYWDEVERVKEKLGACLHVIINGDAADDPYHATTEVVSTNKATILESAITVYERARNLADHFFMVRGTVAHVGVGAWIEETLARDMDAEKDEEARKHS